MRKIAILGIALLAAALAGCGQKADEQPENQVAPADQFSEPAPAATEPAPMTEQPSDMSAPMEGAAPEQEMAPPVEGEPKAAE